MQSLINNIIQSLVKKEKSTLDDTNSAAHAVLQQPRKRRWKSRFSIMVRESKGRERKGRVQKIAGAARSDAHFYSAGH